VFGRVQIPEGEGGVDGDTWSRRRSIGGGENSSSGSSKLEVACGSIVLLTSRIFSRGSRG
jgi:hypothetical protein